MKLPRFSINDARVIAGGGFFLLTLIILLMIFAKPELAEKDLFKTIAQGIVLTGFIGLAGAFLFTGKDGRPPPDGGPT